MAEADILPVDRGHVELAGAPDVPEELHVRVGDRLRAARERLGISRAELCLRTKINERHLEALEDSDFAALPARIYAVGFARSYAGAVGLDPARIAAEVRSELSKGENPPLRPPHQVNIDDPAKMPSGRIVWFGLALGALLIAAGTVFWRSYYVPAVDLPPVSGDVAGPSDTVVPELSPQAQISPTAESAVPAPATPPAATVPTAVGQSAVGQGAVGQAAPRTIAPATQAIPAPLPAPVPEAATPGANPRDPG